MLRAVAFCTRAYVKFKSSGTVIIQLFVLTNFLPEVHLTHSNAALLHVHTINVSNS